MKKSWIFTIALTALATASCTTASTVDALNTAIAAAAPGDEIVIADGCYADWKITIDNQGTENAPIIIRPATPGGVTLTGSPELKLRGKYIEIRDLTFKGCNIPTQGGMLFFDNAQHCRVTGCRLLDTQLEGSTSAIVFLNHACDNRVDHNRIIDIRTRSIRIRVNADSLENGPPARNRIDHNLFQDVPPLGKNGGETIQIGSRAKPHSDLETMTLVDHNLFIRCNGEAEIISSKTTGNRIVENIFKECQGELVLRHGDRATVKNNRFEGCTGAVRVHGEGHTITGNTIIHCKTGIVMAYGTPDENHPASYLPVCNCLIADNIIVDCETEMDMELLKGKTFTSKIWPRAPYFAAEFFSCTIAPHDNTITNNILAETLQSIDLSGRMPVAGPDYKTDEE